MIRSIRSGLSSGTLSITFLTLLLGTPIATARGPAQITQALDESVTVILEGNTHPATRTALDQGRVSDSLPLEHMYLQLNRAPETQQGMDTLIAQLHDPTSANYHRWLTADEIATRFGPADQDVKVITGWLTSHGLQVNDVHAANGVIDFSGTAGSVAEAFHTEIRNFAVNGSHHIANVRDPSIPAALAPAIHGVVSLHDFRARAAFIPRRQYTFLDSTGAELNAIVPADLATIYNFNPLYAAGITGKGQTIAVIDDSNLYDSNDWTVFRHVFGLDAFKSGALFTVHPGGCTDPGINPNGDDVESTLDVEWASAAAPDATVLLATCASTATTDGVLIAMQKLVQQERVPQVFSFSYINCEAQNGATANAAYKEVYLVAVLEGVSVFVAAGDNGAAGCDYFGDYLGAPAQSGVAVSGLASTPYNVAVGGTDFGDFYTGTVSNYWSATNGSTYGSALSYVPEVPWNQSCAAVLTANYLGYATTYGINGLCAASSSLGFSAYNNLTAGGGGPSNCATGATAGNQNTGLTPSNGTCQGYKKPAWQSVVGNPNDGVRDVPDVSMSASSGWLFAYYVWCFSDPTGTSGFFGGPCVGPPSGWSGGGGTSNATPVMAGIQALVNQRWGGRHGNPNPVYYAIARHEYGQHGNGSCASSAAGGPAPRCSFHDITTGDIDLPCIGPYNCYDPDAGAGAPGVLSLSNNRYQPAYKAGVGWDFATGLGTVNAANLVLNPIWGEGSSP